MAILAQPTLFEPQESDARLMQSILELPKIDLHRHLTGSIDADIAIRIAAKYDIVLPTYITADLHNLLFNQTKVSSHEEYFLPWETLNRLYVSSDAVREIILNVISRAAQDGIIYLELRTGPRGFLGRSGFGFGQFLETIKAATEEGEDRYRVITRWILGIPRHIFGPLEANVRSRMCAQIFTMLSPYRSRYFVGVDLNGVENAADPEQFEICFKIAREKGFPITIHAGECGPSTKIAYGIHVLKAARIGHGIAAANDEHLLQELAAKQCVLEVCPTSNEMLGVVPKVTDLPLRVFKRHGVPFVICTDNPARCRTSLSAELFKVARGFGWSMTDIRALMVKTIECAFVDVAVKNDLLGRVAGLPSSDNWR